jgi:tetratricopeptide (TPR) repeat protein
LSFFDTRAAFERVLDAADAGRHVSRAHGVTFGPIDELPFADVDAWEEYALPVAAPHAYPLAADLRKDGSMRRPGALSLTHAEALLRALAATTEDELDAGRWQKRVAAFDGVVELTFTLPYLLEAEAGQSPSTARPPVMPRLAERAGVRLGRLMENRAFESVDDANAELALLDDEGLLDDATDAALGRELTPLERAQELAYDAMEAEGRLRIKRARQALAISPDCADAWVVLAEDAPTHEAAMEHYTRAVTAAAAAIGTEQFESLRGEFWGHLETRPYMRARLGLAQVLRDVGNDDEALAHYRELLRLNPNDNQGVRYLLLTALLELEANDEAGALLAEYPEDIQALWSYARLLWHVRVHGDGPDTRDAYAAAVAVNPYVVRYLLDPESVPFDRPPYYELGSRDEAVYVAQMLEVAFFATAGAADWLRAQARRFPPRSTTSGKARRRR